MESDNIPRYCFLIGQFIIQFENNKDQEHYKEVNKKFLDSIIADPKLNNFPYINPRLILMLCYGLIVFPKDYWQQISKIDYNSLSKEIIQKSNERGKQIYDVEKLFDYINSKNCDTECLIRRLRNSIAHARVQYDEKLNQFVFKDENQRNKNDFFEARITISNLSIILTGIGKYFSNVQK